MQNEQSHCTCMIQGKVKLSILKRSTQEEKQNCELGVYAENPATDPWLQVMLL